MPTAIPVLCPRCGADRAVLLGVDYGCGRCGAAWPVEPPALPRLGLSPPLDERDRYTARRDLDDHRDLDDRRVPTGRHATRDPQ